MKSLFIRNHPNWGNFAFFLIKCLFNAILQVIEVSRTTHHFFALNRREFRTLVSLYSFLWVSYLLSVFWHSVVWLQHIYLTVLLKHSNPDWNLISIVIEIELLIFIVFKFPCSLKQTGQFWFDFVDQNGTVSKEELVFYLLKYGVFEKKWFILNFFLYSLLFKLSIYSKRWKKKSSHLEMQ